MIPGIAASVITEKNKKSTNIAFTTSNIKSQKENEIPCQGQTSLNNAYMFNGNNTVANSQSRLKETEQSTKNSTKDNFLDYTFLSHRSQLSSSNLKKSDVSKSKDYIYDLINTWELNIDLLQNLLQENKKSESNELVNIISDIRKKFDLKKHLRKETSKIKGKILIEKQIIEEHKRKFDENDEYYKDQIKEFEENRENKEEYIKVFEKKLKEVEIYVQKNTKNLVNSKYEKYKDFKIADFIDTNTDLLNRKDNLLKEVSQQKEKKAALIQENQNYKNEMNFSFTDEIQENENIDNFDSEVADRSKSAKITPNIYHSDICCMEMNDLPKNKEKKSEIREHTKEKLKNYYNKCKYKVKGIEMRTQLMKNYFNDMSNKLKYFSVENLKKYKKSVELERQKQLYVQNVIPFNNFDIDGEIISHNEKLPNSPEKELKDEDLNCIVKEDKSNLNFDMTRKLATMMDFSIILNKRNSDVTNMDFGLDKTELGNIAHDLWEFSCIGKN